MKRYEVEVKVWDVWTVEVEAENEEKAAEIASDICIERGIATDGGRDIESITRIKKDRD